MSTEQILLISGSIIVGLMGLMHLLYTFFSNKFDAYDPQVKSAMQKTSPVITKDTTMWKAWIGFNASHSLGPMFLAAFTIPLAYAHMSLIENSLWFSLLPAVFGVSFLLLAKKYWFKLPFIGILMATLCFITAAILIHLR